MNKPISDNSAFGVFLSGVFLGVSICSAPQWYGLPHDCGGSARRSLMTERSERMSEEAPGHLNVNGNTYASGFGHVSRSYLISLSDCNILSFL